MPIHVVSDLRRRVAVSPGEAAQLLGCSRNHVYLLLKTGVLSSTKLGNLRRIPLAEVQRIVGQP